MPDPDFNLLAALDVLLAEGSVSGAAKILGLSDSAMSRTLLRLRGVTGDPLLVRAGRRLVPTPHATALRDRVRSLTGDVKSVLTPPTRALDLAALDRNFTIRANEGFIEAFAARLVRAVTEAAPGVRLRFAPKPNKEVQSLRDGLIDLEIGVIGDTGPEIMIQSLFHDHFVAAIRPGHPLAAGPITPERYAAFGHVVASRRGRPHGPVDDALAALGLQRRVIVVVPSFPAALAIAATSDLIALVTNSVALAAPARPSGPLLQYIPLPVPTSPITVSQLWHPRMHADPAHAWLRTLILTACRPGADPRPPQGDSPSPTSASTTLPARP